MQGTASLPEEKKVLWDRGEGDKQELSLVLYLKGEREQTKTPKTPTTGM